MVDRRNSEIEHTQMDFNLVIKQSESAISEKYKAVAESIKMTEKRIEQERVLMNDQMESLTADLKARIEKLLNMRRDNTTRCFQLENKLGEKAQKLVLATDTIKLITDANNNLMSIIEEMKRLSELDAQKKLCQEMYEEKAELVDKVTKDYQEVKSKLNDAIEKYGDLEKQAKKKQLSQEVETLTQLQRQLELQQGSKPSTSSGPTKKSMSSGTDGNSCVPSSRIRPLIRHEGLFIIEDEENKGTGRSVPDTPLQASSQEARPGAEEQPSHQTIQSDGEDGVFLEDDKSVMAKESEEEGRDTEATPSTNTRSRTDTTRAPLPTSRRGGVSRSGPTPIVWVADQRGSKQDIMSSGNITCLAVMVRTDIVSTLRTWLQHAITN